MAWFGKKDKNSGNSDKSDKKEEKSKSKSALPKKPSLISRITAGSPKKVSKKRAAKKPQKIKKKPESELAGSGFVEIAKSGSRFSKSHPLQAEASSSPLKEPSETMTDNQVPQLNRAPAAPKKPQGGKFWRRLENLPDNYGDNYIYLLVRDPYWLYCYWEIQKDHQDRMLAKIGGSWEGVRSVLRVYDVTSKNGLPSFFDIFLQGMAINWYLEVQPNRSYLVEIGLLHRDGRFVALARSNQVSTPRAGMSEVLDEEWMDIDFDKIYALSGGFDVGKSSAELRKMMEERLKGAVTSGSGAGMISSFGSPVRIKGKRGFWFVLDCELIVYGATEPDATVTLQGKPVKLRPDGTFTLRFAYPDGKQVLDAHAYSADGIEERIIVPIVERKTERPAPVLKA